MHLILCNTHETIQFAAEELKKYLQKISFSSIQILPATVENLKNSKVAGISLGTADDLIHLSSDVKSSNIDDAFEIKIHSGSGYLCGSNPRSVLFAVYALLRGLGYDWPNPQTEIYLPKSDLKLDELHFHQSQKAATRHRGIVLEGANSADNVLDIIRWMPKLYYNSYFIQFQTPYYFFANWYLHAENSYLSPQSFSEKDAIRIKNAIELELKKRDLLYHAVGHAWTSESIGIKGLGWNPESISLTSWQQEHLALINGQRQLFNDITLNTNLCYSHPESAELFANQVLKYMQANPDTDFLHIWLADGYNNICECPNCTSILPSDQYIDILNHLDHVLTEHNIPVKLVFLVYYDLLWAPQTQRLHHPERFVLMFAPISRTFESSYADISNIPAPHDYQRNQIAIPHSVEENLSYLKEWQKTFSGDSFVFDYPLGRAHYGDPGYLKIARTIYHDIRSLSKLGLNGYLSCQEQRCFFPHALPNYLMGRTLWDNTLSFEEICQEFFLHSYGQQGLDLIPLLEKISYTFNTDYWNRVIDHYQPWYGQQLAIVKELATTLDHLVQSNLAGIAEASCRNNHTYFTNWQTLSYLPEYIRLLSICLAAKADGNDPAANEALKGFRHYVQKHEYNLQSSLDVFRVLNLAHLYIELEKPNAEFS